MKSLIRILCLIGSLSILFSRPVSLSQAQMVAVEKYPNKSILKTEILGNELFLTRFEKGGFVLSPADDAFPAILGYSKNAPVGKDNPAFISMCEQYSQEIRKYKSTSGEIHADWSAAAAGSLGKQVVSESVDPLITSTWNQSPYYNDRFPYFILPGHTSKKPYVGCVAVVMGQLINYYEHPARGFGKRWFYSATTDSLLRAEFDTTYHDFGNMPDSLCTRDGALTAGNDQVDNISLLLYQCAISVEMDMQPDGSSSAYEDMMYSLVSYFDYDPDMILEVMSDYTESQWRLMIIQELNAGRPLPYRGNNSGGTSGHAFLLDGYETTTSTYYHFNWGWGGYYDGWFLLSALDPGVYDFNYNQAGIFNIHLNDDDITRFVYTGFEGYQAGWIYNGGGFYLENGDYDMVLDGNYSYGFDGEDQWLISPKIHIPDNNNPVLSIWAKMLNNSKHCTVYISQTDTLRSSFTTEIGTISPANSNWNNYAYSLRSYKNSSIYLGIKYDHSDGYITLDNVSVFTPKVVISTGKTLPETYHLLKVYPNPFNPEATVNFQLPAISNIELNIYDLNGHLVSTLTEGIYDKGEYQFHWDASSHPSGIYICTLFGDKKLIESQKMVLVK